MRKALLAVFTLLVLFSCKKTIIEEVEGDSFRISILPVELKSFGQYKFTGTLDLRHAADHVEYGLVVGKSVNPTIENATKLSIGQSTGSVDFTKEVNGLDTGATYYVRAYGASKNAIQYSANQIIGKVSPRVYMGNGELNYGRPFILFCNLPKLGANASVKVFLNGTQVSSSPANTSNDGFSITAEVPDQLTPGKYLLSISVDNLKLTDKDSLRLFEGRWEQIHDLPVDETWPTQIDDFFLNNDWVYINALRPSSSLNYEEFLKYNYKTQQTVKLTHFDASSRLDMASALTEGDRIHFLCGTSSFTTTKRHLVYNTTSDTWITEADFPGGARKGAVSLLTNSKIYLGMGWSEDYVTYQNPDVYTDMWSYDLSTKVWKKLKSFPQVTGRMFNASFTIGSKIYLTGGIPVESGQASLPATKETWCYDTVLDEWSRKADYPGTGAIKFSSFSIGDFGYVGMGEGTSHDSYYSKSPKNEHFKYDPVKDRWAEVSHLPVALFAPFCGTNNNSAVVGAGSDGDSYPTYHLFVYTPQK